MKHYTHQCNISIHGSWTVTPKIVALNQRNCLYYENLPELETVDPRSLSIVSIAMNDSTAMIECLARTIAC